MESRNNPNRPAEQQVPYTENNMKRHTIYYCTMLCIGLGLLTGCGEETTYDPSDDVPMMITTGGDPSETIIGNDFNIGDSLGVFLLLSESGVQKGPVAKYNRTSDGWHSDTPLGLGRDLHTAYAHYPYNPAVVDINSVPIRFDLTDFLWARSQQTDINGVRPGATFAMKHLLAKVSLTIIVNGKYTKPGLMTYIRIYNLADKNLLATDAAQCSFDAKTGNLNSGTQPLGGFLPLLSPDGKPVQDITLNPVSTKIGDLLVVPFRFNDGEVSFQMEIDRKLFRLPIPIPSGNDAMTNGGWNQGCHYHYTLTMHANGNLTIGSIVINDWVEVTDPIAES